MFLGGFLVDLNTAQGEALCELFTDGNPTREGSTVNTEQLMRAKLLDSRFTAPSFLRQKKNIEKETNAMHGSK